MSDEEPSTLGDDLGKVDATLRTRFSWYVVAKKEFQDAIRSKGLWILSAVFTLIFVTPVAGALYFDLGRSQQIQQAGMRALIDLLYLNIVSVFLPLVAIFVGVAAITKERNSGSLKILLSMPFSRRDVIVGKVVGRCAVLGVPFVLASILTMFFLIASRITFKPEMYFLFMAFSLGFALVMVAIAVSISGAVSSTVRSFLANAGIYFYFTFVWNTVANEIGKLMFNDLGLSRAARWHTVLVIKLFSPTQAYKTLVRSLLNRLADGSGRLGAQQAARYRMFNVQGGFLSPGLPDPDKASLCMDVVNGLYQNTTVQTFTGENTTQKVCSEAGGSVPFYFSDIAVVVYMLAWIGLAAVFSYRTFDQVDL
jgi:ABC-2 type transport system permease protein